MMKRALRQRLLQSSIILLMMVYLSGSVSAMQLDVPHRKQKEAYKDQVEQLEEAWRVAQLNDDIPAMDKLLSEDYVGITMSGQVVTKMQQLDRMRNRQLVLSKVLLDDVKVKLIGTIAIVTSLAEVDGTSDGAPMHGTYRYTRIYSRTPSIGWKITNFEATRVGPPSPPPDGRRPRPKTD